MGFLCFFFLTLIRILTGDDLVPSSPQGTFSNVWGFLIVTFGVEDTIVI